MIGTELLLEGFTNDYVADTAEDGDIWMVDPDGTDVAGFEAVVVFRVMLDVPASPDP
jgi:hypothetical protein